MTYQLDVLFLILLLLLASMAVRGRRLLQAIVILGAYGFVIALEWALMGAVDVAFTEAVIGAGVWTVFMLAALRQVGEEPPDKVDRKRMRPAAALALLALGTLLVISAFSIPAFGDASSPASVRISPYYIEQAVPDTATPNMVTAVLGDYRSIDTMMEVTVVFAASMAIVLLLGLRQRRPEA
ncbi:MAG: DUF4040 domain-containing protein [Myxococcota bacterium]